MINSLPPRSLVHPKGRNIGIALTRHIIDALDKLAKDGNYSRSYLIRFAIEKTYGIENDMGFGNIRYHKDED